MTLGKRIKECRLKCGYTQSQMASKLSMTEANFSSYERDKSQPPSEKLNQMSSILGVSADYLLGKTNDPRTGEKDSKKLIEMIEILSITNDMMAEFIQSRGLTPEFQKFVEQWKAHENVQEANQWNNSY
ncbi:helix-turn-helix transcriptional regulator [Paenibacillus sp. GYB004]|uniref:helix-turn-helix domain-containing protein n=1 Tax=Paenibacillus sp. GYB004 TaxID=2994393 RepID=UPI002F962C45